MFYFKNHEFCCFTKMLNNNIHHLTGLCDFLNDNYLFTSNSMNYK